MNFYYRNNKPRLASLGYFNVEDKLHVDFIERSHFNAGFHWNPLDGKSPYSFDDFFLRVYVFLYYSPSKEIL